MKINIIKTKNYLGHKLGKNLYIRGLHPSMSNFLLGNRKNITIIDNNSTFNFLVNALFILSLIFKTKGHLLIVNTNSDFSRFVENIIQKSNKLYNISYCNSKWIGGTLTNWTQVNKSIITFAHFSERFDSFLTTNNINFPRFKKMKKSFSGFTQKKDKKYIITLTSIPDILFVINPNENRNIIDEANRLNIPIIALTDSNSNLSGITYPIPSNNHSAELLYLIFSWIIRFLNKN